MIKETGVRSMCGMCLDFRSDSGGTCELDTSKPTVLGLVCETMCQMYDLCVVSRPVRAVKVFTASTNEYPKADISCLVERRITLSYFQMRIDCQVLLHHSGMPGFDGKMLSTEQITVGMSEIVVEEHSWRTNSPTT